MQFSEYMATLAPLNLPIDTIAVNWKNGVDAKHLLALSDPENAMVEFRICSEMLGSSATRQALKDAKIKVPTPVFSNVTVRCTPAQYGLFILLRNRYGGCNSVKWLDARLVA